MPTEMKGAFKRAGQPWAGFILPEGPSEMGGFSNMAAARRSPGRRGGRKDQQTTSGSVDFPTRHETECYGECSTFKESMSYTAHVDQINNTHASGSKLRY